MEARDGFHADWNMNPTICRLCLHSDGFLLGIFNHLHGKDKNIYKKIIDCTALEISSGDGLPHTICHRCLFKLELCLDFRAQCFVSDSTLRQASRIARAHRTSGSNERNGDHAHALSLMDLVPPQAGDSGDVVVVVDPSAVDYDSDYDSKYGRPDSNDHYHDQPSAMGQMAPNIGHYGHMAMMNHTPNDGHSAHDHQQIPSDNEGNEIADNGGEIYDFRNVFMCRYCDRAFTDKPQCTRHEAEDHDPSEPYSCKTCQLTFPDRLHYSAHLKSLHADDKPYDCPECAKMFARRSDLRKHTIVHTGIKPFTCPVCAKSFSRNTNLSKHMRIHAGHKPFVCPRCPKTFITRGDLQRHSLIHSGRKPFPCRYCNLSFSRRDKLLRHEKRHYPGGAHMEMVRGGDKPRRGANKNGDYSGENMVIDIDPLFTAGHDTSTDPNVSEREDKQAFAPDDCQPFGNATNDTLMAHDTNAGRRNEFSNRDTELSERELYDKGYEKGKHTKSHVTGDGNELEEEEEEDDMEEEEPKEEEVQRELTPLEKAAKSKRYPCLQCHRRFSNMEGLKFHIQQHHNTSVNTSGRPFTCPQCPKGFIRKRELERHMTTHSGMKPFNCTSCDKRFGRKDKLVRHMRIHDGSNVHVCPICTTPFSRKDSLWQHMRNHQRQEQLQYQNRAPELPNDSSLSITRNDTSSSVDRPGQISRHHSKPPSKTPLRIESAKTASSNMLQEYLEEAVEEDTLSSSSNFQEAHDALGNTARRKNDDGHLVEDKWEDEQQKSISSMLETERKEGITPVDAPVKDKGEQLEIKQLDRERSSDIDEDDEEEEDEEYDEDRRGDDGGREEDVVEIDDDLNEDKDLMEDQQQDENSNLENPNAQSNSGDPGYDEDPDLDAMGDEEEDDIYPERNEHVQQQRHSDLQNKDPDEIIDCDSADEEDSNQYARRDGDPQQLQDDEDVNDDYDYDNNEDDDDDDDDDVQMTAAAEPRSVIF